MEKPDSSTAIRLTQYSHGAGCGCKISPKVLDGILHSDLPDRHFPGLLVGNHTRDDAAVFEQENGDCLISTTDFFMPIVDDPYDFGRIASVNAISDVYAMGGRPLMAIAILGWPINQLAPEIARQVLEGSRSVCHQAGIPLAGGHSIDNQEPLFGLAVTGIVPKAHLKQNSTARPGHLLYLTKPLGVGIISTAQKKGLASPEDLALARQSMLRLNDLGAHLGPLPYVSALTDVTGFGLLGHLTEMCEGSGVQAILDFDAVPRFTEADHYLAQKAVPGGTHRNWESFGHKIGPLTEYQRLWLADPQTSGGLLIAVEPHARPEFEAMAARHGLNLAPIGHLEPQQSGQPLIRLG